MVVCLGRATTQVGCGGGEVGMCVGAVAIAMACKVVDSVCCAQVSSVKRKIEGSQGKDAFPCAQQLLIHQGKVLKDETTMADNKVAENGFLVVMLTKVGVGCRRGLCVGWMCKFGRGVDNAEWGGGVARCLGAQLRVWSHWRGWGGLRWLGGGCDGLGMVRCMCVRFTEATVRVCVCVWGQTKAAPASGGAPASSSGSAQVLTSRGGAW